MVFNELEAIGQVMGADPTTITFTSSTGETLSCTTAGRSVTLTVASVWTPGFLDDPAGNHDPDGDSDGTTIVIDAP